MLPSKPATPAPSAASPAPTAYDAIYGMRKATTSLLGQERKAGMAVNPSRTILAVSYPTEYHIRVFRAPLFGFERVFGKKGKAAAAFMHISRICFASDDVLLIADIGNDRVQSVTITGTILRSFKVKQPASLAVHGDLVAVGTVPGPIEIHSLSTGRLIRSFGARGTKPGLIGDGASGLRFSPDGARLLVAEFSNHRLSMFTTAGTFIQNIGVGLFKNGFKDVEFTAAGDIIACDQQDCSIRVFSPDGNTLVKEWKTFNADFGGPDSNFCFPNAIAMVGSTFYVMDDSELYVFKSTRAEKK